MRNGIHSATAAAVALFVAGSASATVYNFTANLSSGTATGTMTGTVDLAFVSGGGSGTGAASNLTIATYPAGVPLTPNNVPSTWPIVADNTFTVTGGAVTSFLFFSGAGNDVGQSVLCLSSGGSDSVGSFTCQSNLIELHQTDGVFGYNFNGSSGITFTAMGGVPEPASWVMMLVGVGAAGGLMRASRRKSAATVAA